MKRTLPLLLWLFTAVCSHAQTLAEQLAGNWTFKAANNGKIVNGVYSAGIDEFAFIATVASDGQSLDCHADCLYKSVTNVEYPADWRIVVEEDGAGNHRLGWVLSKDTPAFTKEFDEPATSYADDGFMYWGSGSEAHHYIYLLAENADASALVATTFWSAWSSDETTEYSLKSTEHNSQKLYAVVAAAIPCANTIGYAEIWASPKIIRTTGTNGVSTISNIQHPSPNTQHPIYDLQGRRLTKYPSKGLYIQNGKKYFVK